ncbi:UNVERIFIED_CONTAM: hypothetical protein LBW93_00130 [Wolbachia endosymbiont of Nasonia longicornis]
MASLTFKDSAGANVVSPTIKSIIYEDAAQNKYTFGVDNTSVFNTFRYEPNGAAEIDYSATATNFMTGGAIATLLGIGTNVDSIKTKTDSIPADLTAKVTAIETATNAANLGDKVTAIQTKIDKMPADLDAELGKLAKSAELTPLAKTAELAPLTKTTDITAIKAKTDKMPADLNAELIKLTTIAETLNGSPQAAAAAKAVLESSFKKAIEEAGEDGSEWLKNEIKEIVSQPSFEIPKDSSEALSWDW